jgi:hypothetical protein
MGSSSIQLTGQTYHQEESPGESDETYVVSGLGDDSESINLISKAHVRSPRSS